MAVQSTPVPSVVQPPHCSRFVSASMHSKPSPSPVEHAVWCAGHARLERLRLRAAAEAARAQTALSEHQPAARRGGPGSAVEREEEREDAGEGGRRRGSKEGGDAPEAQMLSELQPNPLGTPAAGMVAHFWVDVLHDWLTHCWSGEGIGLAGSPLAQSAPEPPHMPSVPQKKKAWQSLLDVHASPR